MYRYHEIIKKRKSPDYCNDDAVYRRYNDYFIDADAKDKVKAKINDKTEKRDYKDVLLEVHRNTRALIVNDEKLSEKEKMILIEYAEYEAAEFFDKEFIQYFVKLVKAFSSVADECKHELEITEQDDSTKIVIREYLNYNICSYCNMTKVEKEIQELSDYGTLLEEKIKSAMDILGDKIFYKNIAATTLTTNDDEAEYDGVIHMTLMERSICFNFGNDEFWSKEGFSNHPVDFSKIHDKVWRVSTTNIVSYPLITPDDSFVYYDIDNGIRKYGNVFRYDNYTERIYDYEPGAAEEYIYITSDSLKTSEIIEFTESVLKTKKSIYTANKEMIKEYNLEKVSLDPVGNPTFFKMIFFTDDFEVLYVYGDALTDELRYGYIKFVNEKIE